MGGIGKAIGSIGSVALSPFTAGPGMLLNESGIMGGGGETPKANALDPNLVAMQQDQAKTAKDYTTNLKNTQADLGNAATDTSRAKLANTLAATNAASNSRGLLYGGYNQGQRANAEAQSQAGLSSDLANINTTTQGNANNMTNQAIQSGLGVQNAQNQINQNNYNYQLQQRQMQQQQQGGLLGGVAGLAGMAAGGR